MIPSRLTFIALFLVVFLAPTVPSVSSEQSQPSKTQDQPEIGIAEDIGGAVQKEAEKVKDCLLYTSPSPRDRS